MNKLAKLLLGAAPIALALAACGDNNPANNPDASMNIDAPDVDPCDACVAGASCTPAGTCECPDGFAGDGTTSGTGCTDIDECMAAADCVPVADGGTCVNSNGSFMCGCEAGYSGDGTTAGTGCTDIDECTAATDDCVDAAGHGTCTNSDGGFACGCEAGYGGDGTTGGTGCTDIDECAAATDDCVDDAAGGACTNSDGGFTCACVVGYAGDGTVGGTGCTDVDECAAAPVCGPVSTCLNDPGTFRCELTWGPSPFQDFGFIVDPLTYTQLTTDSPPSVDKRQIAITAGQITGTVTGVTAMTKHPVTSQLYVVAKVSGVSGRVLATVNPIEGSIVDGAFTLTTLGNLGDNFATLAFGPSPDYQLYGVTGDGATVPESLFEIDIIDEMGTVTLVVTLVGGLGAGADGETICYNPDDGFMYHWSGNGTVVMERFEPVAPFTPTNIVITGTPGGETFGCRYVGLRETSPGVTEGVFVIQNISSTSRFVTTSGVYLDQPTVLDGFGNFGGLADDLRGIQMVRHNLYVPIPATDLVTGGAEVRLYGGALAGATNVRFGGEPAMIVDATNDGVLVVTAPAASAPGPVEITADLASGITVRWTGFAYVDVTVARLAWTQGLLNDRAQRAVRAAVRAEQTAGRVRRAAKGK